LRFSETDVVDMALFNVEDNKLRPPMRVTQRTVPRRGGYAIL
jgi:hypothetical protein